MLDDLNAKLSPTEKAHDLALRALLEEKLYFYQVGVLVQMLSHAYRQLNFTCHQVQKLTLDYPTPSATKDGTRTITPRDHTFSQRCLTLSSSLLVCSPTAKSARFCMVRVPGGTPRKRLARLGSRSGRMSMRFSLRREGRIQRPAPMTRHFGSWEGMGRLRRTRFCSGS